jgi:hypothetical protein
MCLRPVRGGIEGLTNAAVPNVDEGRQGSPVGGSRRSGVCVATILSPFGAEPVPITHGLRRGL